MRKLWYRTLIKIFRSNPITLSFAKNMPGILLLKDIDADTVIFCTASAAKSLSYTGNYRDIWDTPSSKYWPDYFEQYHEDDLRIFKGGVKRVFAERYNTRDEQYVADLISTTKWPLQFGPYRLMCAHIYNISHMENKILQSPEHGEVLDAEMEEAYKKTVESHTQVRAIVKQLEQANNNER